MTDLEKENPTASQNDLGHEIKRTKEEQHLEVLAKLSNEFQCTGLEEEQSSETTSATSEDVIVIKPPDEFEEELKVQSERVVGGDLLNFATGEPETSTSSPCRDATNLIPLPPPLPVVVPKLTLIDGYQCPMIGVQTFKTEFGVMQRVVTNAIDLGYRFFDCASANGNEQEIGNAIKSKIRQNSVTREDLFVCGKLPNTSNRPELVQHTVKDSLQNLGLDYFDLYLIHWPFSLESNGQFDDTEYISTWKALEDQVKTGKIRSIGVANFNGRQILRLCKHATVPVVTNQVECHPYLAQENLSDYCRSKNVVMTAYDPLGPPDRQVLQHATLREMSERYEKSPAQIILKYQMQRGHVPILKMVTVQEMLEFINLFDFDLAPEDIEAITGLNCGRRITQFVSAVNHKDHPFVHDPW